MFPIAENIFPLFSQPLLLRQIDCSTNTGPFGFLLGGWWAFHVVVSVSAASPDSNSCSALKNMKWHWASDHPLAKLGQQKNGEGAIISSKESPLGEEQEGGNKISACLPHVNRCMPTFANKNEDTLVCFNNKELYSKWERNHFILHTLLQAAIHLCIYL